MKLFYGILCVLGTVLPYSAFIPWLIVYGINPAMFFNEISSSQLSLFAWSDVLVSAVVLIGFIVYQGAKDSVRHLWAPLLATCTVGVSLGLPLFLLFREYALEDSPNKTKQAGTP